MENIFDNEIPRYIKKKDSNVSKSKEKSKHKHEYKDCFLKYKFNKSDKDYHTSLGAYCPICGKLGDVTAVNTIIEELKGESKFNRSFLVFRKNMEEIENKYKDIIPTFYMDSVTDKHVNLE